MSFEQTQTLGLRLELRQTDDEEPVDERTIFELSHEEAVRRMDSELDEEVGYRHERAKNKWLVQANEAFVKLWEDARRIEYRNDWLGEDEGFQNATLQDLPVGETRRCSDPYGRMVLLIGCGTGCYVVYERCPVSWTPILFNQPQTKSHRFMFLHNTLTAADIGRLLAG